MSNGDAAVKLFDEAIRLSPGEAGIRLHVAIVYAAVGLMPKASTELNAALRLSPQFEARDDVRQLRQRIASN